MSLAILIGKKVASVTIFCSFSTGQIECIEGQEERLKGMTKFAKKLDLLAALKSFQDEISKNG